MNKGLVEIEFTEDFGNNKKGDRMNVVKGFGNTLVNIRKVAKFPAAAPKKAAKKAAPKKDDK